MTDKPRKEGARLRAPDGDDIRASEGKVDVKAEAQKNKMLNADPVLNASRMPRSNQPNAGGRNREAGDRKGRGATELEG